MKRPAAAHADTTLTQRQSGEDGTDKGKRVWLHKQEKLGRLPADSYIMHWSI